MSFNQDKVCCPMPFPIIADDKRELSVLLGMLDPDERDKDGMPLTARCVSFHRSHAFGQWFATGLLVNKILKYKGALCN